MCEADSSGVVNAVVENEEACPHCQAPWPSEAREALRAILTTRELLDDISGFMLTHPVQTLSVGDIHRRGLVALESTLWFYARAQCEATARALAEAAREGIEF